MYQIIVLGLGFLLLFGTGYLIKNMDKEGVITSKITGTNSVNTNTTTVGTIDSASSEQDSLEGTYVCTSDSGCQSPSTLVITKEGEVSMSTSYDSGVEILQEIGTWKGERDGGITILLTGTDGNVYSSPHVLSVRYVSKFSLSGIAFDSRVYKDWVRPVFRKQESEE